MGTRNTSMATVSVPQRSRSPMRARLQDATRAVHLRLERRVAIIGASVTLARYRDVLRAFFGYYAALEPRMVSVWPATRIAFVARAPRIERDLAELGERVASLRLCSELPRVMTTADVAGCAYVVEGAALGGQVIGRELRRKLGIRTEFFAGEGAQTSARFAEVLAWIDDVAIADSCPGEVVRAACDTFATFERWLARRLDER